MDIRVHPADAGLESISHSPLAPSTTRDVGDGRMTRDSASSPEKPLSPWLLTAFCGVRCTDPLSYFFLFPFINEMLLEYGIAKDARSTGYTAGLIEASMAAANAVAIPIWAHVADTLGRRYSLIPTTMACALIGSVFGFVKSYAGLIFLRVMGGLLNGQSAVAKTYLAEVTTEKNQAFAFSLMGLAWQVAWCFSAFIGGYLAHPERTFPTLATSRFVQDFPYALPPLLVAIPPFFAALLGVYTLRETLQRRRSANKDDNPTSMLASVHQWTPGMKRTFYLWTLIALLGFFMQSTLPVFFFAPVSAGGLAMPTNVIGRYYVARTILIMLVEVPIYPRLHKRLGTITMLRCQVAIYPLAFLLIPITSSVRRYMHSEYMDWASTLSLCLLLVSDVTGQTMFISGDLLCTNAAPFKEDQAMFNAVVELDGKIMQLLSAWLGSSLLAYSAESQIMNGYLVWFVIWLAAVFTSVYAFRFQEARGWRHAATQTSPENKHLLAPQADYQ